MALGGQRRTAGMAFGSIVIVLAVLGVTLHRSMQSLGAELSEQMVQRESRVIGTLLRTSVAESDAQGIPDIAMRLLEATLLPELPGVLSAGWISADFSAAIQVLGRPATPALPEEVRRRLRDGLDHSQLTRGTEPPVLLLVLPMVDRESDPGYLQLEMDGSEIAAELATVELRLKRQFWKWLLGAGIIAAGSLSVVFSRLARSQSLLEERSERLVRANRDLILAAKTNAVGAVASHLVHGLRNPVAALQQIVRDRHGLVDTDPAWKDAASTTRQLREQIDSVIHVLRDDSSYPDYPVPVRELVESVVSRLGSLARSRGVEMTTDDFEGLWLSGKAANLIRLILENLGTNAIEATPQGQVVSFRVREHAWDRGGREEGGAADRDRLAVEFLIEDQGPGFTEEQRSRLFVPGNTTKGTGSGLGLAICRQLALHLGAELELGESGPRGSVFCLRLPPGSCEANAGSGSLSVGAAK